VAAGSRWLRAAIIACTVCASASRLDAIIFFNQKLILHRACERI
jgi:hypothetical protein